MSKPASASMPRTAAMNGAGPQTMTSRSRKSGAISRRSGSETRPPNPVQRSPGVSASQTGTKRKLGRLRAISSSSARKMMSAGVRAKWTKTMSRGSGEVVVGAGHRHQAA